MPSDITLANHFQPVRYETALIYSSIRSTRHHLEVRPINAERLRESKIPRHELENGRWKIHRNEHVLHLRQPLGTNQLVEVVSDGGRVLICGVKISNKPLFNSH